MTTGVLVMAYGTPSSRDGAEAYYTRIRHGRPPSPEQLADLVRRYDAIGGASPLAQRTAAQVAALAAALRRAEPGAWDVRFGSKYEPPLLEEAAAAFAAEGFTRVVGLALAPHSASMSTGAYMARARAALGERVELVEVGAWWDTPGFCELVAARVTDAISRLPEDRRASAKVYFSAHSLPESILEHGDTYPEQLRASADRTARLAGVANFDVCWQSAGRTSDTWLGPDILDVLRAEAHLGTAAVVSCPIGFVSDHLEVLYDLDVDATNLAAKLGLAYTRTASLNDDPAFIDVLTRVVTDAT